ncbi:MAG: secondary thiamine-phosphate synthase enzyme YjbQ [Candidatus Omnitrophota bacterium]
METFSVKTSSQVELIDITSSVQAIVSKSGVSQGMCTIFVPHTTAGITINENADPSVRRDIIKELDKIVPHNDGYAHSEGNSAAHIKASLLGFSQNIIIDAGHLQLGTWQGIYFCEFDGPRSRKVFVKITKD